MTWSRSELVWVDIGGGMWVRADAIEAVYADDGENWTDGKPRVHVKTAADEYVAGKDMTVQRVFDRLVKAYGS